MFRSGRQYIRRILEFAIAAGPWLASMYFLYWLEHTGTWTSETPHRGKLSVAVIAIGMGLSFFILSWFSRRRSGSAISEHP